MKSALYRNFSTDKDAEVAGVWVNISPDKNEDGTIPEFLVTRAGGRNTKYKRVFDRVSEPYREEIQAKTLPGEKADALEAEITVDGLLLDWRHVQDSDGKEIPFDRDIAIALLTELSDARAAINLKATVLDTFRLQRREISAKN